MPDTINDGGPAFPERFQQKNAYEEDVEVCQHGMTLRDWFAGQALAGRMARVSNYKSWDDAALDAYEVADAMLAAREARNA